MSNLKTMLIIIQFSKIVNKSKLIKTKSQNKLFQNILNSILYQKVSLLAKTFSKFKNL